MNDKKNDAPIPLCYSSEEARTVLDSLSAHIAIVDENGVILDTNRAWRDFAVNSGMPEGYDSIGDNYLAICKAAKGEEGVSRPGGGQGYPSSDRWWCRRVPL
jgi:hypothetical protein